MNLMLLCMVALLAYAIGRLTLRYAASWGLVVVPNHRSSHTRPTPQSGGIGMVVAGTLGGVWLMPSAWPVLVLAALLALVGLCDDVRHLSPKWRLLAQMVAVVGLLASVALPYPFLLLAVVAIGAIWWINLFNFMDGTDGLAASQAIFMLLAGAGMAALQPEAMAQSGWWLLLVVASAAIGFLALNWPPARLFMGDVGSVYLAFMVLVAAFSTVAQGLVSPFAWLLLAAAFACDASVTLIVRMARGQRWYEAHRSHAYQILARRWSHGRALALLWAINLLWLLPLTVAVQLQMLPPFIALMLAYGPLLFAVWKVGAGRA